MIIDTSSIFIENLIEILLTLIVTFNLATFSIIWSKIKNLEEDTDKNAETMNILLNRIFGIDQDPTDKGHIMETKTRFDALGEKLEEIYQKQEEEMEERRADHEKVNKKINSIIEVLKEDENIEVKRSDFE